MKLALQIILCLVGLLAAYFLLMTLFGLAIQVLIIGTVLAAIAGVCRWQYLRWQSRRPPDQRAIAKSEKHIEKKTEEALRELERKVNKS